MPYSTQFLSFSSSLKMTFRVLSEEFCPSLLFFYFLSSCQYPYFYRSSLNNWLVVDDCKSFYELLYNRLLFLFNVSLLFVFHIVSLANHADLFQWGILLYKIYVIYAVPLLYCKTEHRSHPLPLQLTADF